MQIFINQQETAKTETTSLIPVDSLQRPPNHDYTVFSSERQE